MSQISQTQIWCPDDWETPPVLAEKIAQLLTRFETNILEPCAGSGSLVKALAGANKWVAAYEISQTRFSQLEKVAWLFEKSKTSRVIATHCDFLNVDNEWGDFDAVVANFPFSQIVKFIEHSMKFLKPHGRLLMIAPLDCFCAKKRNADFLKLDLHIHAIHPIVGRVAYLKNGKPETNRQIYDAVFDIRSYHKLGGADSFIQLK